MANPIADQQAKADAANAEFNTAFIEAARPSYDTHLTPAEEQAFRVWKARYAPSDSGLDYDLRGAFKAKIKPDPTTGHWPDTYKKPSHPTFSTESQYAKFAPHLAGTWGGPNKDQYIPAPPIDLSTGQPATRPPAGANVISPHAVGPIPPANTKNAGATRTGTRNEAIYSEK